jgi:hypothetical protein
VLRACFINPRTTAAEMERRFRAAAQLLSERVHGNVRLIAGA